MNILNNVPVVIAAVAVLAVLLFIAVWLIRNDELRFLAGFCLVWCLPIGLFFYILAVVQTKLEQTPGLWPIAAVVFGVIAFLRDPGSALAGAMLGLIVGLLWALMGWFSGSVRTFEEMLLIVGHPAIVGWIVLPLLSLKYQGRKKI